MATHSCDVGYGLFGGSVRTCQSDRTWSGGEITCQRESYSLSGLLLTVIKRYKGVSCGNPPTIGNGLRIFRGTSYQDFATYSCDFGYLLSGSATVTCQASGSWSIRPTCVGNIDEFSWISESIILLLTSYLPWPHPQHWSDQVQSRYHSQTGRNHGYTQLWCRWVWTVWWISENLSVWQNMEWREYYLWRCVNRQIMKTSPPCTCRLLGNIAILSNRGQYTLQ